MNKINDEPFIRIAKRDNISWWKNLLLYIGAVVFALVAGGIFVSAMGTNPFEYYGTVITGNFKNAIYIKLLIRNFTPLLITSLGIAVAFKMRFWNIGAEGQFLMGAICAAAVALSFGSKLPAPLSVIVTVLSGMLGGGIYGVITALFKVKFGTNETLLTLMFNYLAFYLVSYNVYVDFFKVPTNGIPTFKRIPKVTWLTELELGDLVIDTSFIIALVLIVLAFIYFNYTKHGYEINVVGDSPNTANYAGIKVKAVIVRTMFLSSAIIGLAGALQLTGSSASHTLGSGITGGVGWTGIIVAWLAKLNPIGIFIVSFLMSVLDRGSSVARTNFGISESVADIMQGIILFSILAFDFFIRFKIVIRGSKRNPKNCKQIEIASDSEAGINEDKTEDNADDFILNTASDKKAVTL